MDGLEASPGDAGDGEAGARGVEVPDEGSEREAAVVAKMLVGQLCSVRLFGSESDRIWIDCGRR